MKEGTRDRRREKRDTPKVGEAERKRTSGTESRDRDRDGEGPRKRERRGATDISRWEVSEYL